MKGNLFLKLEGKTNSKNNPKCLNVTFLDTFCICSRKMGENGVCALIQPILHFFGYNLCRKLTKSLALHSFEEIFDHSI